MYLFIIVGGLFVVSLLLALITAIPKNPPKWVQSLKEDSAFAVMINGIIVIAFVLVLGVFLVSRGEDKANYQEKYLIYSTLYETDAFADSEKNTMWLHQEILNYNDSIEHIQKWSNSKWTNCFYSQKFWSDVQLIEIED